jgi:RNA polymerase sigma factor (sigma-70 family)
LDRSSPPASAEDFNNLLAWLDPDRERAGEKYETIRQQLVKMFAWQRCLDPEELADETITRVARRVSEVANSYQGDPSRYFYGVAKSVLHESLRQASTYQRVREGDLIVSDVKKSENGEQLYECLDKCMLTLTADNRELLLAYYESSKQARIDTRKTLATQLGVSPAALRVRLQRIRMTLEKCIEKCMKSEGGQ